MIHDYISNKSNVLFKYSFLCVENDHRTFEDISTGSARYLRYNLVILEKDREGKTQLEMVGGGGGRERTSFLHKLTPVFLLFL